MDPNAARDKMVEAASIGLIQAAAGGWGEEMLAGTLIRLAEAVHDLDEWLRMGGFLPDVWTTLKDRRSGEQHGRMQDVDIHVPHALPTMVGKEVDDDRPRVDGGVCTHPIWFARDGSSLLCGLDRGHSGPHDGPSA